MVRIQKIGIRQTAKVVSLMYFFMALIFFAPIMLTLLVVGAVDENGSISTLGGVGGFFVLLIPVLYALMGYLVVASFSFVYNVIAKRFGGVEFEFGEELKRLETSSIDSTKK